LNLPLLIAKKYFFSRKKKNFINVISIISMTGVAVGTLALVIVLSVFNGLEEFIRSLYGSFDPDIKVMPVKGKSFELDPESLREISSLDGVSNVVKVIEDNAYVKYRDAEMVVKLKGVGENFLEDHRLEQNIVEGDLFLKRDHQMYAILGRGIQYTLNINHLNDIYPLQIYYPKRRFRASLNPAQSVNRLNIMVAGIFAIEKQFDLSYVIVPFEFAENLMDYEGNITSLEIMVDDKENVPLIKSRIRDRMGDQFQVLDSDEQHSALIRAIKIEKLFVFLTFSFIIAVSAINIFFSLTMLAIDKKKDIAVLFSLGASRRLIQRIFIHEGAIIAFTGAILGMTVGIILLLVQQKFGLISMGIETSVIDAYPVKIKLNDFIFTGVTIIMITLLFSSRPAILASRSNLIDDL
jgi:lipoprotein-releasing system permease protein